MPRRDGLPHPCAHSRSRAYLHTTLATQGVDCMDITVPQPAFHRALRLISRAVPVRSALPILQNVLLEAGTDTLTLSATDLELGVVAVVAAAAATPGRVAVPARLLTDFVAQLPPEPVRLLLDP